MRTFNIENAFQSAVKGVIRWFAWIIFFLSLFFIVGSLFAKTFDVDLSLKSLSWYALATAALAAFNYFNFLSSGKIKGREYEGYISNYKAYKSSIDGLRKADVDDYLKFAKAEEKESYIAETCIMLGMTKAEILKIKTRGLFWSKQFTLAQKVRIRNIHNKHFKSRLPKNAAQILNILSRNPKGSHGLDINATRRYVVRASIFKIVALTLTALFGFSLVIELGIDNPYEVAIKLVFALISLIGSIGSGHATGLKSTSEIEKDVLGAAVRFLNDMDIWLGQEGKKKRYTKEEITKEVKSPEESTKYVLVSPE